jgi:hypothetical protein
LRYDAAAHEERFAVPQAAVLNDGKAGTACSSEHVRPAKGIRQIFARFGPDDLVADPSPQALTDWSRDIRCLLNWRATAQRGGEANANG